MTRRFHSLTTNFVSKWFILAIDLLIVCVAFGLSTLIRFNFELDYINPGLFKWHLVFVLSARLFGFLFFNSYSGIVRHTSFEDAKSIIMALAGSTLALWACAASGFKFIAIPYSILVIDFFVTAFVLISSRFFVKIIFEQLLASRKSEKVVIIYGAGHLGRITKNSLLNDKRHKFRILCFIDDNPQLKGKTIEGIPVINKKNEIKSFLLEKNRVHANLEIVFAIQSIGLQRRNELIDELLELGIPLKILPPIKQWMNGELRANQIHQVKIEDLLQREPIKLNNRLVSDYLKDKVIMITGAAGSIGSEIVRQALRFSPTRIILIDQAESPMYDIESELRRLKSIGDEVSLQFVLCNITNIKRIENLVKLYRPDVIFHAAAYKHVPLMEAEPYNAIATNVLGTCGLADLALKYDVSRFVFVSTDKAVNPTNVMGASKRLAEMYIQSLSVHQNKTRFITTRFGNVLGSNGSVIPLFKRQIEAGGPVTVTDPDIIRYFMTIPEACQLVLEAGTMGKGGEIFVFEMGEPVRILNLAKRMIRLSGFKPDEEIEIKFTGLRPGEKLYEELLSDAESTKPTHHPKILIAQVKPNSLEDISREIDLLRVCLPTSSRMELVSILKRVIPEYKSQNSDYEVLDKEMVSRKASLK